MELFHANRQWATRPADQRFRTLDELYTVTHAYAQRAGEKTVAWSDLRTATVGDELVLVGDAGVAAKLTHYAFGQLSARVGAPGAYMRTLPATLAAQNLNFGLKQRLEGTAQLLFHSNDGLLLRAATSEKYARIWNYEVVDRLRDAAAKFDLVPARSTFRAREDDENPALYASDHDLFAFLMTQGRVITDPAGQGNLFRGVITTNSEVGASSLKVLSFLFRDICGNHIIWGAKELAEISLTHIGKIRERWAEAVLEIRKYLDASAGQTEAQLVAVTRTRLGGTKDEVLDAVFGKRLPWVSRKLLGAAYDAVVPEEDGDPRTAWGLAQGLTRYSQTLPYADERQQIDRAAGKLLEIVF